ncbi:MAG: hypothetical protein M3R27_05480 [Bacteroidota bacterium]|nr:hypothetical protein [Bacteroidota bacterium]
MKFFSKKNFLLSLIILLLLILGYYRDFLFKQINAMLKAWDFEMDYAMPFPWRFLENYYYDTIVNFKWLLTIVFTILFLLVSMLAIHLIFRNKKFLRITVLSYVAVTVISALFAGIGILSESSSVKMYELARYLMGMAQSPVILMILIPAFKLSSREQPNIEN